MGLSGGQDSRKELFCLAQWPKNNGHVSLSARAAFRISSGVAVVQLHRLCNCCCARYDALKIVVGVISHAFFHSSFPSLRFSSNSSVFPPVLSEPFSQTFPKLERPGVSFWSSFLLEYSVPYPLISPSLPSSSLLLFSPGLSSLLFRKVCCLHPTNLNASITIMIEGSLRPGFSQRQS